VLVHGRDPGGADAERIESIWLASLNAGLAAAGSSLRVVDDDASFVFYGATLDAMVGGEPPPPITVHGMDRSVDVRVLAELPPPLAAFTLDVAREVLAGAGIDTPEVATEGVVGDAVAEALAHVLATIDRLVPGLSGAVVLLLARDVHAYLYDDAVRDVLDAGLAAAIPTDEPAVVVAHSLGAVVAYRVLRHAGVGRDRDVPLFLTLGSPLAIRAIRDVLAAEAPLRVPPPVGRWVDARDPRDLLALHGLTPEAFPLAPGSSPIELLDVDNRAPRHHAAAAVLDDGEPAGYVADAGVARLVGDALAGPALLPDTVAG
jgi:hypothetical protein